MSAKPQWRESDSTMPNRIETGAEPFCWRTALWMGACVALLLIWAFC